MKFTISEIWNSEILIHNLIKLLCVVKSYSIWFDFSINDLLFFSLSEYNTATVGTDLKQLELTQADLQRATEEIRGLHSINSELRSQLEVLSSRFVNSHLFRVWN